MEISRFAVAAVRTTAIVLVVTVLISGAAFCQEQPTSAPPPLPPPGEKLSANQLDGLVAPIALYPDPLISQILAASTYPREITQAVIWMRQHPELKEGALTQAAQQQKWDASVQALVIFPQVLNHLNQDKTWTTNLGNAFLAQQSDVMDAVQRMRRAAKAAGKLSNSPKMKVVETADSGQTVIELVPANPNVLFVPAYNPVWIWGPAAWYPYPRWFWPRPFGPGVYYGYWGFRVGAFFGPAWGGWGGWGWHPGWANRSVVVNNTFIRNNNFTRTTNVTNTTGTSTWAHDPSHRQGVPYSNHEMANRYHGSTQPAGGRQAANRQARAGRQGNAAGHPRAGAAHPARAHAPAGAKAR